MWSRNRDHQAGSAYTDHRPERRFRRGRVSGGRWPPQSRGVQTKTVGRFRRRGRVSDRSQVQQDGRSCRDQRAAIDQHGHLYAVQAVELQRRVVIGSGPQVVPRHTQRGQDTDADATTPRRRTVPAVAAPAGTTTLGSDQRPPWDETAGRLRDRDRGHGRCARRKRHHLQIRHTVIRGGGRIVPLQYSRRNRCGHGRIDRHRIDHHRGHHRRIDRGNHGHQVQQKHVQGPEDRGQRTGKVSGAHHQRGIRHAQGHHTVVLPKPKAVQTVDDPDRQRLHTDAVPTAGHGLQRGARRAVRGRVRGQRNRNHTHGGQGEKEKRRSVTRN